MLKERNCIQISKLISSIPILPVPCIWEWECHLFNKKNKPFFFFFYTAKAKTSIFSSVSVALEMCTKKLSKQSGFN